MKHRQLILRLLGLALILTAVGILAVQQIQNIMARKANGQLAEMITAQLPERTTGSPADYSDAQMPVLQVDGADYVCLMEVPELGVLLPVRNDWDTKDLAHGPCRFWGSIYDGSFVLGGSYLEGQFDFCSRLDVGQRIVIRDMLGAEFRCSVSRIDRSGSAEFEDLSDEEYPLTLFVREKYESRYIVVRCQWDY